MPRPEVFGSLLLRSPLPRQEVLVMHHPEVFLTLMPRPKGLGDSS